jgi:hypothetical protein
MVRPIDPASVRAYLDRDWQLLRARKRAYWRERLERGGLAEAFSITEQMRTWMRERDAAWPTEQDREEDRATKLPVDLVLAGPGLEQQFLDEVRLQRIGNRRVPVISVENLIVTKLLAARPKDLEDVREIVASRGSSLDHERINELLAMLEQALGQGDLIPLYQQLRHEAARG